ncbi:protein kinase domain-containing protein [Mycobacterium numidiamassiliense]|uniref:protein kinase domain-containing protein n=1 Tax=Mycobacterium numidiamassiliense TaxID=1841861 RepID=UPI00097D8106|nr:protein kinase [Mycobacterium numidiamassiliense]
MATDSFGHYELLESLGLSAVGQVFRAYDVATDRVVALKVLPANMAEDDEFQSRFRREARIAANLDDPHVVPIHSYGEIDGQLYVDMRLVEGRDLTGYMAEHGGRLSADRAVAVIEQVAEALDAAREEGLIHRDVKPSNILITNARDFVYLIDFGIARTAADTALTRAGHTMGTVAYMAPERIQGTTDHRADVYSLACVLYESLTGQRPFPGDSMAEQLDGHLNTPPPRPSLATPDVPPAFDEVIARGMAKDPDQRYQTAVELAEAARATLSGAHYTGPSGPLTPPGSIPTSAQPAAATSPPSPAAANSAPPAGGLAQDAPAKPSSNRRLIVGVVGGSVLALGAVIALVISLVSHSDTPAGSAQGAPSAQGPPHASHTKAPRPGAGPGNGPLPGLPAFAPPMDLGANCQYPPTQDAALKPANPPPSGKISTSPPVIRAIISTNVGDIGLELDNAKAPCTVNSFISLVRQQFFNGTQCGKLIIQADFGLLQCGGPENEGLGGPGYEFADEYPVNQYSPSDPALKQPVLFPRGTLTMAPFGGPNPNQSQFDMMYKDSVSNPDSTVFGTIDEAGLTTIDAIVKAGIVGNFEEGLPAKPVTINSVRID